MLKKLKDHVSGHDRFCGGKDLGHACWRLALGNLRVVIDNLENGGLYAKSDHIGAGHE
jgi:hypothetical protein